jgi:hypothetical protein
MDVIMTWTFRREGERPWSVNALPSAPRRGIRFAVLSGRPVFDLDDRVAAVSEASLVTGQAFPIDGGVLVT